jgi:hypothetical protein
LGRRWREVMTECFSRKAPGFMHYGFVDGVGVI